MQLNLSEQQIYRIILALKQVPLTRDNEALIDYLETIRNPLPLNLDEIPF